MLSFLKLAICSVHDQPSKVGEEKMQSGEVGSGKVDRSDRIALVTVVQLSGTAYPAISGR